jgi:hypothetical protein
MEAAGIEPAQGFDRMDGSEQHDGVLVLPSPG